MPFNPTIAWLTVRQLFVRRRLIAALVFALAPFVIALIFRSTHADADAQVFQQFADTLYGKLIAGALLGLTSVVIGTSAFGAEIDDGTVVYLLVKPIPRWHVVLTKYVVAVASIAAVMVPAMVLPWFALSGHGVDASWVSAYLVGAGVGAMMYAAVFLALGIITNRALVYGLIHIVVIETTLSQQVAGLRSISVRAFVAAVASHVGSLPSAPGAPPLVDLSTVWTMGSILLIGGLALAMRRLARYEMAERGA